MEVVRVVPMMLFHRTKWSGTIGREELAKRADDITEGRWLGLVEPITSLMREPQSRSTIQEDVDSSRERRGLQAQSRVQQGQVSRARQALVGAALAPGNNATLEELQRRRPQVVLSEIPPELLNRKPESVLVLDRKIFAECLRKAGSAPGPGGCTNEMLRVCLDDPELLHLITAAAEDFARGATPPCVSHMFTMATMTALHKKDGGVRGIATGTTFRRLVAKTLARQFSKDVEAACAPFQFALSTRAGVDCVGHSVRAATDGNPELTVLSIVRCSRRFGRCLLFDHCFHLCVPCTPGHHHMSGQTMRANVT